MAGRSFELLAQADGLRQSVTPGFAALAVVSAALGVVSLTRMQARHAREESRQAERVFERIAGPMPGGVAAAVHGADDPAAAAIGFSARSRPSRVRPPEEPRQSAELAAMSRMIRQEAEVYLEHHRMDLKHHSAYQRASLWAGFLGFSVIIAGAVLTFSFGLDAGVVTAVAGLIPTAAGGLFYRRADIAARRAAKNLGRLEEGVRRSRALQAALAAASLVDDDRMRDRMFGVIGMQAVLPAAHAEKLAELLGDDPEAILQREASEDDTRGEPGPY